MFFTTLYNSEQCVIYFMNIYIYIHVLSSSKKLCPSSPQSLLVHHTTNDEELNYEFDIVYVVFWQEASAPGFSGWEGRTSRSRVSGCGQVTCRPWAATRTGPPGNPTTLTVTSTAWRWTWEDSTIGMTTTVKTDSTSSVKCRMNHAFLYTQSYCSLHFFLL